MIPRMKFSTIALLSVLGCLSSAGCATRTETFDVSVRNDTAGPVIVWLTKIGGPEQEGWRSPESIAINFVVEDERVGGEVVPPGHKAETGKLKAKLDKDSRAVLRVYKGEMTMSQLLANDKDSPSRDDLILIPGRTTVAVVEQDSKLKIVPFDSSARNKAPGPKP